MKGILDALLVGGALLASVLYAIAVLGPRAWRQRTGAALASRGFARVAQWIAPRAGAGTSGTCGGCGDGVVPGANIPDADGKTRIPLGQIRHRPR